MNALGQRRLGLTLVELLIAISIIAILGALVLGVAAQAGEVARESRTKSLVARIHTLVIERYGEYRTRRVELNANWQANLTTPVTGMNLVASTDIRFTAMGRLAALRELICLEMPDRWSDITGFEIPNDDSTPAPIPLTRPFRYIDGPPSLWLRYAREYNRLVNPSGGVTPATGAQLLTNQGAELLYLMVINGTGDGEARTLFNQSDVGDTDNDGALEFLDGWGQPIGFLRWAPGFDSDAQLSVAALQRRYGRSDDGGPGGVLEEIAADHDPLDVFRLDNPAANLSPFNESTDALTVRGWRLVPLVYSIGGDGEAGIQTGLANLVGTPNPWIDADPSDSVIQRLGQIAGDPEGYADNIHNHSVATLSSR